MCVIHPILPHLPWQYSTFLCWMCVTHPILTHLSWQHSIFLCWMRVTYSVVIRLSWQHSIFLCWMSVTHPILTRLSWQHNIFLCWMRVTHPVFLTLPSVKQRQTSFPAVDRTQTTYSAFSVLAQGVPVRFMCWCEVFLSAVTEIRMTQVRWGHTKYVFLLVASKERVMEERELQIFIW